MERDNIFIIIQARMTSTRLPGKVLLPLCGKSALEMMLARLADFKDNIIIATTDDGSEAPIVTLCKENNIRCFRGDTDNVLERYYRCARDFGAGEESIIVRLTSDCPLIDSGIVKKVINFFEAGSYDYASNCVERTFPRGLDCEVFSFPALEKAHYGAQTQLEKEHVTTYMHTTHKRAFSIGSYRYEKDMSRYRLTLDEPDDYKAIQEVYRLVECKTDFSFGTLVELLENNEQIYRLNAHVEQKKS